ncbi:hypothetical protein LINGRAHAP2_LOCUS24875 [Linum grandiflorum]
MRTPNPARQLPPLFLLLLVILAPDISTCTSRHLRFTSTPDINGELKQSNHQILSSSSSSSSSPSHNFYFPKAESPQGTRERDRVYGTSYRTVPAGPNPLHN